MRKLIPIILALVGVGAGGAVGFVLKPQPEAHEAADAEHAEAGPGEDAHGAAGYGGERAAIGAPGKATDSEYMPLSRKLIVPFRRQSGRKAFLALDVSLEVAPGEINHVEAHEPKLVDAFLRTLIAFAATGAFDDDSHAPHTLNELNHELKLAAQAVLGESVREVLIANMLTQDA